MQERGSGDFTLIDVSRVGKVSIGSIYNRIESKDELLLVLQLVISREIDQSLNKALESLPDPDSGLSAFASALLGSVAETFKHHANSLRPLMQAAASDPRMAEKGRENFRITEGLVVKELMRCADEIVAQDKAKACKSAFRIFYAAIARHLGFGSLGGAADEQEGDWATLKLDICTMVILFLKFSC